MVKSSGINNYYKKNMNQVIGNMDDLSEPPFHETYKTLLEQDKTKLHDPDNPHSRCNLIEQCELPLIDLTPLTQNNHDEKSFQSCKEEIAKASKEWGFFQVVNHGVSLEMLETMRNEQVKVFKRSFEEKSNGGFFASTYRWGSPTATCLGQLSWSEAFHIPMSDIIVSSSFKYPPHRTALGSTIEQFATTVADLAQKLAEILAEQLGKKSNFFQENCLPSTCYLRLNRYPPCPIQSEVYGLMPHTDSDFLTVLYQDQVGGLQLIKDGKWFAVRPNPEALIINIGDLFQAWSNNVYKSVQHKVVTNPDVERFSTAYFFCPLQDAEIISSCQEEEEPSLYKRFSFREYREQVHEDVSNLGYKIGLPRFLASIN